MNQKFSLNVNGKVHAGGGGSRHAASMPCAMTLASIIRISAAGWPQCGACTVHLDGQPIRSCITPVSSVGDGKVVTLAGLGTPEKPHPLQTATLRNRCRNAATASMAGS